MKLTNISDLVLRPSEQYAYSKVISEALGLKNIFVSEELIPPERSGSGAHAHSEDEELLLILEGHPHLIYGNEEKSLKPGDVIALFPRDLNLHHLENRTDKNVRYLVVRSHSGKDKVIYSRDLD